MSPQLIAVDLGGTNLRFASYNGETPTPERTHRIQTAAEEGPEAVIGRIIAGIDGLVDPERGELRIGIGAPGPLDPVSGVVYKAPNLPGWVNIPLKQKLHDHFGVPVAVGNDANLAALGEWSHGAGKGTRHLIYLTISTGVGGGIISNGELLLGSNGLGAELGHITLEPDGPRCGCGQQGHLEALASGTAIARAAEQQLDAGAESTLGSAARPLTSAMVGEAAKAGDSLALQVIEAAARYLGIGMADFAHIFNPEIFVLGGGVSQLGDLFLAPVRQEFKRRVLNPAYYDNAPVVPAKLGDDAGLVGAMALAAQA